MMDSPIREASALDHAPIIELSREAATLGDTYVFDEDTPNGEIISYWFSAKGKTFVLEQAGRVVGICRIGPIQIGRGSHIANGSYLVAKASQGKGFGTLLFDHSLQCAKKLGFLAMQFNLVISTNQAALSLWKKSGFQIIGTVPNAFRHRDRGLVDAHIMHRKI